MAAKCPQCQLDANFDEEGNIICHFCGYDGGNILDDGEDTEEYNEYEDGIFRKGSEEEDNYYFPDN